VEVVRRLFDEFQAGMERDDPGAWFDPESLADDFEWIPPTPLDGRSVWRRRERFVEFIRTWTEEFEDWPIGPPPRTASTCRPRQSAPRPRPACSWRFSPPAGSPADAC